MRVQTSQDKYDPPIAKHVLEDVDIALNARGGGLGWEIRISNILLLLLLTSPLTSLKVPKVAQDPEAQELQVCIYAYQEGRCC